MKSKSTIEDNIVEIVKNDPRYPPEAYNFINEAVVYTTEKLSKRREHISVKQLLEGIAEYAKKQFGPLAGEVLAEWNLNTSSAVGDVVLNMINANILLTNKEDDLQDFSINLNFDKFCSSLRNDFVTSDSSFSDDIPKLDQPD